MAVFNFQFPTVQGITASAVLNFCTIMQMANKVISHTSAIAGPIVDTELNHLMASGLWDLWEHGQLASTSTGRLCNPQYMFTAVDRISQTAILRIVLGFLSAAVKCGCQTVCLTFPKSLNKVSNNIVKQYCIIVFQAILLFLESESITQIASIGFATENELIIEFLEELIQLCKVEKFSVVAARKGRRRLEKKHGKENATTMIKGFSRFVRFKRSANRLRAPLVKMCNKLGIKKTTIERIEVPPFVKLTVCGQHGGAKKLMDNSAHLRKQYGPPGASGHSLFVLGHDDVDEVLTADTMISNTALFRLLFEKVADFNASRRNHEKVCLLHPDFFGHWQTAASAAARRRAFQTWASFTVGAGNKWFLVPILQHVHFFLVQIGINEGGQCLVHVFDSLAAPETPARLNYNDLQELATFLIPGALDRRVQFAVAGDDILLQRNTTDCGIHTLMNAWACLGGNTIINDVRDIDGRRLRLGPGPAKRQVDLARRMFGEQLQRMLAVDEGQAPRAQKRADNASRNPSSEPTKKRTRNEQPKEIPEIIINSSPEMELDDSDCQIISDDEEHATSDRSTKMKTMNAAKKTKKSVDNARKNSSQSRLPSRTPNRDHESDTKRDPRALNALVGKGAMAKKTAAVRRGNQVRQQQVRDEAKQILPFGANSSIPSLLDMVEIAQLLKQFVKEQATDVVRRISGMLNFKVAGSKSPEDRKMRQLTRIRFHLFAKDDKEYAPIQDVYYAVWKVFMGYVDASNPEDDINVAMEALRDCQAAPDLPRNVDEELQLYMEELYGRPLEEAQLAADKPTVDAVRYTTKARPCDEDCPKFDEREAVQIHNHLTKTITRPVEEMNADLSTIQFGEKSVLDWLNTRAACSQGIRSMLKRFRELSRLLSVFHTCETATEKKDRDALIELVKLDCLPDRLREIFNLHHMPRRAENHHMQQAVEVRFRNIYNNFSSDMENQETTSCQVCHRIVADRDVQMREVGTIAVGLDKETISKGGKVRCCQMCWKSMRPGRNQKGGKIPQAARVNGFEVDYVPRCLTRLNQMEQMLIEKTRAVQKIVHLKNVDNKTKTGMKATNGILVMLPTEIEATVDHVANTLPSMSNMTIKVSTGWEKQYQVSMPNVVKALEWLKANNPQYADIKINRRFHFELGKNIYFDNEDADQKDADDLVIPYKEDEEDDGHLLTQNEIEFQTFRPIDQHVNNEMPHEQYALRRHRYAPLSVDTPNVDLAVFPLLHPKGRGGMSAARTTPLQFSKYIRTRVIDEDRRWATSPRWLSFMYALKAQIATTSVQGISARLGLSATGNDFDPEDPKVQDRLSCAFRKVRGSTQYWQSAKYCLRAHVATFGTPTWFVTLNPDIWHWTDLHKLYGKLLNAVVNKDNIEAEICKDPVPFARFWRRKLKAFLKNVILAENGPLGTVTHYFYRIEYQHRGTQHVHCLFWTKDRPAADAGSYEIAAFLDKHVTARLPDKKTEPELFELVDRCQRHYKTHSGTCKRHSRYKGKPYETCRFGYPRPALQRSIFFTDENAFVMPNKCQRPYYLARRSDEVYLNDYNAAILLMWKANVDVQFIPSNVKDVLNYVTAYTTKGEKAKRLADKDDNRYRMEGLTVQKQLHRMSMKMLESREAGLLEIVDDLMGHHNFEFDCAHEFIPTDKSENRNRMLKPKARLEKSASIYESNWIDTYYPNRGSKFELYSLYNMMTQFEVKSAQDNAVNARDAKKAKKATRGKKQEPTKSLEEELIDEYRGSDDEENEDEVNESVGCAVTTPEYHTNEQRSPFFSHPDIDAGDLFKIAKVPGKVFRKRKPVIGRFFFNAVVWENAESVEEFYRRVVMLFVPWTREENILKDNKAETFTELWSEWLTKLKKKRPDAAADIERVLKAYRDLKKEEEIMGHQMDAIRRVMEQLQIEDNVDEEPEIQDRHVDVDLHNRNKDAMNDTQTRIFEKFMKHIADQELIRTWNKVHPEKSKEVPESIRMFLSGTAGTGKSFLIRNLADALTLEYTTPAHSGRRPAVLIAAPTGIAALAIGGNTIHSLFKIEVSTDGERQLQPLSQKNLDQCRMLCSNVKLIVIDEISMCSNIMLLKLHRRLAQISGDRGSMFGGYNVLLLGDLLQLPPVRAPQVFQKITSRDLREYFGTVNMDMNMWRYMEYEELTENMRQRGDQSMAAMLGRMRVGVLNREDVKLLESRMMKAASGAEPTFPEIAKKFVELQKMDPGTMALFPTNAEVITMNKTIVDLIQLDCITFNAEDSVDESSTRALRNGPNAAAKLRKIWQQLSIAEPKNRPKQQNKKKNTADEMVLNKMSVEDKMHGGLPAKLVVAVGARVMLRRNINVTRRLVNGATGIVRKIDPAGQWIEVEFDAEVPFVHVIQRMEARYQRGVQEIMVRRQFPLVLAYAATIHKSQGMTLKNVIIRSLNIFTDSMFFVAASRVTTLEGLHLAGLNVAAACKVNKPALLEYNRLRATIDLDPVGNEPEDVEVAEAVAEAVQAKKKNDRPQAQLFITTPKAPAPKRRGSKREDQQQQKRQGRAQRVAYENIFTDQELLMCMPHLMPTEMLDDAPADDLAFRAALFTLSMMEFVCDAMQNGNPDADGDITGFNAIHSCLLGLHRNVWQVVDEMKKNRDLWEVIQWPPFRRAFEAIFRTLPRHVRAMLGPYQVATFRCRKCKTTRESREPRNPVIYIDRQDITGHLADAINAVFGKWRPCRNNCEQCGGQTDWSFVGDSSQVSHKYLVAVQLSEHSSYRAVPKDPVCIDKHRYLLVGAIRFKSDDGTPEYWYRSPTTGWLLAKDGHDDAVEESGIQLENFNVFVWTKKEAQRVTKRSKETGRDVETVLDQFEDMYSRGQDSDDSDGDSKEGDSRDGDSTD